MGKIANLVFGEKYGDVNDPKTNWTTVGAIMTRRSNQVEPDAEDVEALKRLVAGGFVRVRVSATPNSKAFDGWLSVFEPRDWGNTPQGQAPAEGVDVGDIYSAPATDIDLSEIPF